MRRWLLTAAAAVVMTGAFAEAPSPTAEQIAAFVVPSTWTQGAKDHPPILLVHWVNDARAALGDGDMAHATKVLAAKYGLPPDQMAELLRLWIASQQDWTGHREAHDALDQAWVRLAEAGPYKPLVMQAVAKGMGDVTWATRCDTALFTRLLDKAPDKIATGWPVLRYRWCQEWLSWMLDHAGERRFVPLTEALNDQNVHYEDGFPIYDWLTSTAGLAHVAAEDREAVALKLRHDYALALWQAGLVAEGLKAFEALPPLVRENLLAADQKERVAHADGLAFDLGGTKVEEFRLHLAAALLVAGRRDDARIVFARSTTLPRAQKYLACHPADVRMSYGDPCGDPDQTFAMALLLDAVLGGGSDKLGLLAQTFFADGWLAPRGVVWVELSCRTFAPRFSQVCTDSRNALGNWREPLKEPYNLAATASVLTLPRFAAERARYYGLTEQAQKPWLAPPPNLSSSDLCDGTMVGGKLPLGPGRPGQQIAYRDPQTAITLYGESDGRHLVAIASDGTLKWARNPFEDSHLCPYRNARPVIAYIEPAVTVEPEPNGYWPKKKTRVVILHFDSSQFGAVDLETGEFTPMGQN